MGPEFYLPLALLFLASADPSRAQSAGEAQPPAADSAAAPTLSSLSSLSSLPLKLQYYDVGRPFELNCSVSATSPPGAFVWKVNGTLVERVEALKGRYKVENDGALFRVEGRSHEDDFGVYTCGVDGVASVVMSWEVRGRPVVKLQPNTNVVEGQKLRMVCRLVGKPYPAVEWRVRNGSDAVVRNHSEGVPVAAVAALAERVALNASEQGVAGAELLLEAAERADAGVYECVPLAEEGAFTFAVTTLRVKDKYAALWPFLGICAEVFVLCAIILIYEKRRSKPELDDSDTDNHDQKKS